MTKCRVTVVGGGLAGCEAALQLLSRGYGVDMYEMRPGKSTGAHTTGDLAELVCSNSLKSEVGDTASATLKEELDALGCRLLALAREARVPSGAALAVDRAKFSALTTEALASYDAFRLIREEVTSLPSPPAIIAAGPLMSAPLAEALTSAVGGSRLWFYDAVAPIVDGDSIDYSRAIVDGDSIDYSRAYFGGRYGKGDDYLNLPMEREEYAAFREALVTARTAKLHDFEEDAMRFGPLRPVGLRDPRTGRGAYAVVQLRREHASGECYNMVGFQTNLAFPEQDRVFRMIPALENAEFLRRGVMHRNTYIGPGVLGADFGLRAAEGLYAAGQISGVEGYVESIMSGLIAGVSLARKLSGLPAALPPATTVTGALTAYVAGAGEPFQPMNANFGLLPPPPEGVRGKERKKYYRERAVRDIINFADTVDFRA